MITGCKLNEILVRQNTQLVRIRRPEDDYGVPAGGAGADVSLWVCSVSQGWIMGDLVQPLERSLILVLWQPSCSNRKYKDSD